MKTGATITKTSKYTKIDQICPVCLQQMELKSWWIWGSKRHKLKCKCGFVLFGKRDYKKYIKEV